MQKPKLRKLKHEDKKHLTRLLRQLTEKSDLKLDSKTFRFLVEDRNHQGLVLEIEKEIIGVGFLITHAVPSVGFVARVEDVIVDINHRGKGHGQIITKELIELAKRKKVKLINLTSNPKRKTARHIYEKYGFELYKTGVYKLKIQ